KQTLDPVADEAEDLLLRALRQAQVPQREVDGRGDVPLGLDQRAVEIEDDQVELMHPVEYSKFICHCEERSDEAISECGRRDSFARSGCGAAPHGTRSRWEPLPPALPPA